MNIKVDVDFKPVVKRLEKIKDAGNNLAAPLSAIGEIVLSSVEENFMREGRFSTAGSFRGGSNRWADLADSTKRAREKRGTWPGKKLQVSGGLAASMQKNVSGNTVSVGTNKRYAAIQQFGGKAGRGGKSDIPARPFLVVQDEDIEDMLDVLQNHITKN